MPFSLPWPAILALRGRGFGAETESTPAADAAALSLVALLIFCLVSILAMALAVRRQLRNQGPPSDPEPATKRRPPPAEPRPAWQKPDDWWKN